MTKIQELREEKKLTRKELALLIGVSEKSIEAYEYGKRQVDRMELRTAWRLCNVLEFPIDELLRKN